MDINSIIEQILSNGITNSKGNIELNDNSHLWNLIHKSHDDSSQGKEFQIGDNIRDRYKDSQNQRFSVTYFIYSILIYIAKLIVNGFYRAASFLRSLFTGKPCNLSQSPRFNFIVFVAACIFYIMVIVAILMFFLKSVLLFKPDTRVNDYGAIAMPESCERENYMFLLNTASFWDNSGIKVIKGDDVRITVSGSFFSDIDEMYNSAIYNKMPKYGRTYVTFDNSRQKEPDSSIHSYFLLTNINNIKKVKDFNKPFLAKKGDPTFGSLLVAIRDASQQKPFNKDRIITQNELDSNTLSFTADKSGYLLFAVNDEYIDTVSFNIIQKSMNIQRMLGLYNIAYRFNYIYDSIPKNVKDSLHPTLVNDKYYFNNEDINLIKKNKEYQSVLGYTYKGIDTLTSWSNWDENIAKMWYSDNVGDILINVKIARNTVQGNIFQPGIMTKSYRRIEDFLLDPLLGKNNIRTFIFIAILVFLWLEFDWCDGKNLLHFVKLKTRPIRSCYRRNRDKVKEKLTNYCNRKMSNFVEKTPED